MTRMLLLLALASPFTLNAHEVGEHAAKAAKEAGAAVAAGAAQAKTAVVTGAEKAKQGVEQGVEKAKEGVAKAEGAAEAVIQREPFSTMKESALQHMHNKLVHFPIALGLFGAIFLLLSYRYPSYKWPARSLLFFAAAFAVAAYFTGKAQTDAFDGTSWQEVLAWHKKAGKVSLVLLWGAFLLSFFEGARKFFWAYALILVWFLVTAGVLGGALATS